MGLKVGARVWKSADLAGYEGPGTVVAVFKNWMGSPRYVVAHRLAGGRGRCYHIYSEKQLKPYHHDDPDEPVDDAGKD